MNSKPNSPADLALKSNETIGQRISRVLLLELPRAGRYQPRRVFIELESGICFHFGQHFEPDTKTGFAFIFRCPLPSAAKVALDRRTESRLDSLIAALIDSDEWESPFGVLLENGLIVTQLCNESEDLLGFNSAEGHSIRKFSALKLPF